MATSDNRRLAAILFADIVGYTALMQKGEATAMSILNRFEAVTQKAVERHQGEIIKTYGDGSLILFPSTVNAIQCAHEMQLAFRMNKSKSEGSQIKDSEDWHNETGIIGEEFIVPLRIGIHVGEIIRKGKDIFGNGVNIASRIESIGIAGSVLLSKDARNKIKNQEDFQTKSIGIFEFKNVEDPVEVFALANPGFPFPDKKNIKGKGQSINNQHFISYRKLLLGLGIIITASMFYWQFRSGNLNTIPEEKSIAVLPFVNKSKDLEPYFTEGITEDILTQISKIESFKVLSRFTINDYDTKGKSVRDIGKELNINYLLMGSVRKSENQLRIGCQLINTRDETEVWAEMFDKKLTNIFDIQSEIAEDIAVILKAQMSTDEVNRIHQVPTSNFEAYNLYLKGRDSYNKYNSVSNEKAIVLYNKALNLDPGFALAWAGLSDAYAQSVDIYKTRLQVYLDTSLIFATKAVALNPETAETWKALGLIHYFKGSYEEAKEMYLKALTKNPNHFASITNLALLNRAEGKAEESFKMFKKARALNPLNPIIYSNLGQEYLHLGMFQQSINHLNRSIEFNPANWYPQYFAALTHIFVGDTLQSINSINNLLALDTNSAFMMEKAGILYHYFDEKRASNYFEKSVKMPDYDQNIQWWAPIGLAYSNRKNNNIGVSNALLEEVYTKNLKAIENGDDRYERLLLMACIFSIKNDSKASIEWIENMYENGYFAYHFMENDPWLENIKSNVEFQKIMEKMKIRLNEIKKEISL